ncbi:MAG: hypothetical protein AAF557_09315 [Pseudomonadota bacterium]
MTAGKEAKVQNVQLPRAPRPNETVWLTVTIGPLPFGAEIRISLPDGTAIGTAAPFGRVLQGRNLTFQMAVPDGRLQSDSLAVIAEIAHPAETALRTPTDDELISIEAYIQ